MPQTLDVIRTRAGHVGFEVITGNPAEALGDGDYFGALIQYTAANGEVNDIGPWIKAAHDNGVLVVVAADLLSLVLLKPPGEMDADIVVGTSQRFGVPMGFGGPHAAFFATRDDFKRSVPGRIIGVSKDRQDRPAMRMALQTREQHIRREKAKSNICTAQALLANIAGFYAVYHGPTGLTAMASRIYGFAHILETELGILGFVQQNPYYFDCLRYDVGDDIAQVVYREALKSKLLVRKSGASIGICLGETADAKDVQILVNAFAKAAGVAAREVDVGSYEGLLDLGYHKGQSLSGSRLSSSIRFPCASFGDRDDALHQIAGKRKICR